jgi:hypothetical protein
LHKKGRGKSIFFSKNIRGVLAGEKAPLCSQLIEIGGGVW